MENNEKKTKKRKVDVIKELEESKEKLILRFKTLKVGTEEYNECKKAIDDIDSLLKQSKDMENAQSNKIWNAVKVGGMILLTAVGLCWAHKDDISESIPGKYLSHFVDGLFNRISR